MTTFSSLNLETEINLNSLFTLNYNFDLLKSVIETLVINQKASNQKILDLEDHIKKRAENIDQNENFKSIDKITTDINDNQYQNEETDEKKDTNSSIQINGLIKKVSYLEYQLSSVINFGSDMNEIKKKIKEHDEKFALQKNQFDEINKQIEEINEKLNNHSSNFQEINLRFVSFEHLNPFNNRDESPKGYTNDELSTLVMTLEKKVTQKLGYVDERFKKNEEDILKLKQLEKALDATNRNLDSTIKNVDANKDNITILFAKIEDLRNLTKNMNDVTNNQMKDGLDKLKKYFDGKTIEINESITNITQNILNQGGSSANQSNIDDAKMKEISKRLADLDKLFKVFSKEINIEIINKELARLSEGLDTKASIKDVNQLTDLHGELVIQINYLKDNLTQILDDRKMIDELNWLRKKVENLSSNILTLKNGDESMNTSTIVKQPMAMTFDNSKYVETSTFQDFKIHMNKDLESINLAIKELRHLIDEILAQLKNKIGEKELRTIEEYLLTRIEELKSASNKKFADKNETAKNFKYLDQQIKQIIEVYIKKADKGDNWLLAKKPVNGFSCASCEAYIGELQDNTQYVPWNKYPMRDPNDKLYRIGNGFSKMLQMINVDQTPGNQQVGQRQMQTSYDFYKQPQENGEPILKKDVNLPRIKSNKVNNGHMSADDADMEEMENVEDLLQPKIVKIYKKPKDRKPE